MVTVAAVPDVEAVPFADPADVDRLAVLDPPDAVDDPEPAPANALKVSVLNDADLLAEPLPDPARADRVSVANEADLDAVPDPDPARLIKLTVDPVPEPDAVPVELPANAVVVTVANVPLATAERDPASASGAAANGNAPSMGHSQVADSLADGGEVDEERRADGGDLWIRCQILGGEHVVQHDSFLVLFLGLNPSAVRCHAAQRPDRVQLELVAVIRLVPANVLVIERPCVIGNLGDSGLSHSLRCGDRRELGNYSFVRHSKAPY
jgi:hypothetical protein